MLEKTLKAFLNDYLLKIDNNASIPFYKDNFFSPYICTKYEDLNAKIEIYYYPVARNYKIQLVENGRTIFNATVSRENDSNDAELLLLKIYKTIYISKQEEQKEEKDLDKEINEIVNNSTDINI